MKNLYIIRCVSASDIATSAGKVLGFVNFDRASGYPYGDNTFPTNGCKEVCDYFMENLVKKTELAEYSNGTLRIPRDAGIFNSEYRESLGFKSSAKEPDLIYELKFEYIEIDVSDVMSIKSKILQTIIVEGREAQDYRSRDKAYYKARLFKRVV